MRIATWNVNSVGARLPRLLDWLAATEPDVLCLQELKTDDADFPHEQVGELGYTAAVHGTGRWNGVGILSRVGLDDVVRGLVGEPGYQPEDAMFEATEPRALGATCGGLRIWSVYVPNGRELGAPALRLQARLAGRARRHRPRRADRPVRRHRRLQHRADRRRRVGRQRGARRDPRQRTRAGQARRRCARSGLTDVVPRALKYDTPYTYWDYRAGMFHKNLGMRIDLVYASATVAGAVTDAYVDREARKGTPPRRRRAVRPRPDRGRPLRD